MNNATPEDYLTDEAMRDLAITICMTCGTTNRTHTAYCAYGPGYEPATGCWIDGHWGVYGVSRLVEIAQDYGFEISDLDESALHAYKKGIQSFQDERTGEYHDASEWMLMQGGLADEAEEWLNNNVALPGFMFGWNDGEFFYMGIEWWSEEDEYYDEDHIYRSEN